MTLTRDHKMSGLGCSSMIWRCRSILMLSVTVPLHGRNLLNDNTRTRLEPLSTYLCRFLESHQSTCGRPSITVEDSCEAYYLLESRAPTVSLQGTRLASLKFVLEMLLILKETGSRVRDYGWGQEIIAGTQETMAGGRRIWLWGRRLRLGENVQDTRGCRQCRCWNSF